MSKPHGNAVPLSASDAEIEIAAQRIHTDPHRLQASDPGQVEDNVVFTYLDAFDPNAEGVVELKGHYRKGRAWRRGSEAASDEYPASDYRAAPRASRNLARNGDFMMDVTSDGNGEGTGRDGTNQAGGRGGGWDYSTLDWLPKQIGGALICLPWKNTY